MDIEHVYAAGLIDGEGSIQFTRHSKNKHRVPVVSCSSTTYEILAFLKQKYGGTICKHKTYKDHHKQSWAWKVDYNKALKCMESIIPYMREPEKIRRIKLLLGKYKSVTPRNGRYNDELLAARAKLEKEFFNEVKNDL